MNNAANNTAFKFGWSAGHTVTAAQLFAELEKSTADGNMSYELAAAWVDAETPRRRATMIKLAKESSSDFARIVWHRR